MGLQGTGITGYSRDGEWQFIGQVIDLFSPAVPTSAATLTLTPNPNGTDAIWVSDPVFIHIPVASSVGVNELANMAECLGPSDSNMFPGDIGTGRAQNFRAQSRVYEAKGADVSSASTVTLLNGNLTKLTGTTTTKYITTTGWQAGSRIFLSLASGITITNNAGSVPANTASILLRAGADLTTAAAYLLELVYDGTNWVQPG
jgi:hypothetical protein